MVSLCRETAEVAADPLAPARVLSMLTRLRDLSLHDPDTSRLLEELRPYLPPKLAAEISLSVH